MQCKSDEINENLQIMGSLFDVINALRYLIGESKERNFTNWPIKECFKVFVASSEP